MLAETYVSPEMEIIRFDAEDVICSSDPTSSSDVIVMPPVKL